jgi:tRNA A37 threonylcarbamoyladenosine synthetase subunit TsaC/SUA5/YrdC
MTYGVVATSARAVNALKRRPLEQNVAISAHDQSEWLAMAAVVAVPPTLIRRLLDQRLSVLAPLRPDASPPDWTVPAVRNGQLAIFSGRWDRTATLWERFPRLYGSSANRTGCPPAATAAEAAEIFGGDAVVVDGDAFRDTRAAHAASTMIRVTPAGELLLHRSGAQDQSSGLDPAVYLGLLRGLA